MESNLLLILVTGGLVGAAAGYLGSFMVLKRMALVGDALSHVALPGMAIALTFGLSPLLGAVVALGLAVIGVWYLEDRSGIYPEALVGIFFTTSLAIGILLTPQPDLLEALFGTIEKVSTPEGVLVAAAALVLILVTFKISRHLLLGIVSEDLAQSVGVDRRKISFIYLILVGSAVALGVTFVGTILVGGLVIIPAVAARNISRGLMDYRFFSIFFGVLSAFSGILLASALKLPPGPVVILACSVFFAVSYLARSLKW